jgi:hypothetical protein
VNIQQRQLDLLGSPIVQYPEVWSPRCPVDGAGFSQDRRYRYWLSRAVPNPDTLLTVPILWIMLNPSIANEEELDPTLRRCREFTRRLGGTRMLVANLFAFVSTNPRGMLDEPDPVGPRNHENLAAMIRSAAAVIVGWGARANAAALGGELLERHETVPFQCLGINLDGSPKHPLYLAADTELRDWPVNSRPATTPPSAQRAAGRAVASCAGSTSTAWSPRASSAARAASG